MIDLVLKRRIVRSATPDSGGYRILFEVCGHDAWVPVRPGPAAHCSTCMEQLLAGIRQGKEVGPITPREFLIAHQPKVAESQRDAQRMSAAAFLRKHGIGPKEYQQRIRGLRQLAARGAAGDGEVRETMRMLLMTWSRAR